MMQTRQIQPPPCHNSSEAEWKRHIYQHILPEAGVSDWRGCLQALSRFRDSNSQNPDALAAADRVSAEMSEANARLTYTFSVLRF